MCNSNLNSLFLHINAHATDEVGVDISHHVASFMREADLGVRMSGGHPGLMRVMVERGEAWNGISMCMCVSACISE